MNTLTPPRHNLTPPRHQHRYTHTSTDRSIIDRLRDNQMLIVGITIIACLSTALLFTRLKLGNTDTGIAGTGGDYQYGDVPLEQMTDSGELINGVYASKPSCVEYLATIPHSYKDRNRSTTHSFVNNGNSCFVKEVYELCGMTETEAHEQGSLLAWHMMLVFNLSDHDECATWLSLVKSQQNSVTSSVGRNT